MLELDAQERTSDPIPRRRNTLKFDDKNLESSTTLLCGTANDEIATRAFF